MSKLIDIGTAVTTSAELIRAGVSPQLLATLALRRACGGGVAKIGDHYFDRGRPMPSYLAGVLNELADTRLLAFTEEDPTGLLRVSLTPAGHLRHEQLSATPGHTTPQIPHPVHTDHRSIAPVPCSAPSSYTDTKATTTVCGSVLIPIAGVHYVCAQAAGHTTGPDPTACTDTERTLRWWWCKTNGTPLTTPKGDPP